MKQSKISVSKYGKKTAGIAVIVILLTIGLVLFLVLMPQDKKDFTSSDFEADKQQLGADLQNLEDSVAGLDGSEVEEAVGSCALNTLQDINNQPGGQSPTIKLVSSTLTMDEARKIVSEVTSKLVVNDYKIEAGDASTRSGGNRLDYTATKGRLSFVISAYGRTEDQNKIFIDGASRVCI